MSQREREGRRRRPEFRTALESLEDRRLLSHAPGPLAGWSAGAAAQTRWILFLAKHPAFAARLAAGSGHATVPAGTGGTHATSLRGGTAVVPTAGGISIPENSAKFVATRSRLTLTPPPEPTTVAPTGAPYNYQSSLGTVTPAGAIGTLATSYQDGTYTYTATTPRTNFYGPLNPFPATPAGTTDGTTTPAGATTPTPTGTTTPATPTTLPAYAPGVPSAMPYPVPAQPLGALDNVTLSADDVSGLQKSVVAFASAYTSGQDAAKDKAAIADLKAGLGDVAQSVWAETHVAAATDVASLQKAVNDFAGSYTSGLSHAQDVAAWKALRGAVGTFTAALKNPNAPAGTPGTTTPGTTTPGTPVVPHLPMLGPGLGDFAGPLLNGAPLSAGEVAALKNAVVVFASSYSYGGNKAADKAATDQLQAALADLVAKHWQSVPVLNASAPPVSVPSVTTTAATTTTTTPAGTATGPMTFLATRQAAGTPAATASGGPTGTA